LKCSPRTSIRRFQWHFPCSQRAVYGFEEMWLTTAVFLLFLGCWFISTSFYNFQFREQEYVWEWEIRAVGWLWNHSCFSRESLGRRASCARGRFCGEETSRVSAKFLVISFALLLLDAVKREGKIPHSLLPWTFLKSGLRPLPLHNFPCLTGKHFRTEGKRIVESMQYIKSRPVTYPRHDFEERLHLQSENFSNSLTVFCCTVKERSGIVCFRLGIWRLRGLLRAVESGR
jgi:hypothetical protein